MNELRQLASSGLPEWLGLALTLLGVAWRVASTARRSARLQGERIGELERRASLEQTRRRQVEAVLLDDGLRLPYWPPDGPNQPRISRWEPSPVDDHDDHHDDHDDHRDDVDDLDERYPQTYAVPAVPPFSPEEASRLARHRR